MSAARAPLTVTTAGHEQTHRLGERLGEVAEPGDVFLLRGPFGAGKTVLVQGLARGLDIQTPVTSPSFVLATEHRGRLPLYHVDLFRIAAPETALREGLYEYIEGDGVTAIEWPESLPLPPGLQATEIEYAVLDETARRLTVRPAGERQARAVDAARRDWGGG